MSKNRNVIFLSEEYGDGEGTFMYNEGKYVGEWKNGKQHGQGTFTQYSGDRYEGEWRDGRENGQGTFIWSDGRKYEGEFKDGKQHGQGTLTSPDGSQWRGDWIDNKPWNIIEFDNEQHIIGMWLNGIEE